MRMESGPVKETHLDGIGSQIEIPLLLCHTTLSSIGFNLSYQPQYAAKEKLMEYDGKLFQLCLALVFISNFKYSKLVSEWMYGNECMYGNFSMEIIDTLK